MSKETKLDNIISIAIGGDFCPSKQIESGLRNGNLTIDGIIGSVLPLFAGVDISLVNLECPLTDRGTPIGKTGPHLRSSPLLIKLLTYIRVTGVTLANNHIRDYGDDGVIDTLDNCCNNGIKVVGAGMTLELARQPLHIMAKGRSVAFINVAEQEFSIASFNRAGANPLDLIDLLRDLGQARSLADHIVVIVHGGLEMTHVPSPQSIKTLRFLAEQGVTAVIRHHSHYVQGFEVWQGVPIFYGLGNMLFDLDNHMDSGWYQGLLVKLHISSKNECSIELYPITQCQQSLSVELLGGDAREQALNNIHEYNTLLADDIAHSRAWREVLKPMRANYFSNLLIPSYTLRRIVRRLGLMKYFKPGVVFARYLENILRCDTHREVLLDILSLETRNLT